MQDVLASLEPRIARWFAKKFEQPLPAQADAIGHVINGRSVLISSPTGSGKTLAAFLGVFDWLARWEKDGKFPEGIIAIYVSPLRALAYDLQKNLQGPLSELGFDIRVGLRTGDTTIKERAAMKRRPPHILVTTPESLALLLSQEAWHAPLARRRFLIVDEV